MAQRAAFMPASRVSAGTTGWRSIRHMAGCSTTSPNTLTGNFFRSVERAIGSITDAYIFESAYAQSTFHRLIGTPPCVEAVIHNGVSVAEFDPVPCDPDALDFVFVGEFREAKGIGYLIDALGPVTRPDGRPATAGDGRQRSRVRIHQGPDRQPRARRSHRTAGCASRRARHWRGGIASSCRRWPSPCPM